MGRFDRVRYRLRGQIYGEFSGFLTAILRAAGLRPIAGFNHGNFRQPYLAVGPQGFWPDAGTLV